MLIDLFEKYRGSIAYVSVREGSGDNEVLGIGTSFHVGNGIFVTARHVIENKTIDEIATTRRVEIKTENGLEYIEPVTLEIIEGPYLSESKTEDVAIFKVKDCPKNLPAVPLGKKDNLSINDNDYVLSKVLVMGYPPVPMTKQPHLLAVSGEVNAVIELYHSVHPHFVISSLARGGFSGGVVLSEFGHAIGLVTESLLKDSLPAELGFMSALNAEAIHKCIVRHYSHDLVIFGVFYDPTPLIYIKMTKEKEVLNNRLYNANIRVFDDDRDIFVELSCSHSIDLTMAYTAFNSIVPLKIIKNQTRSGYIFAIPEPEENPSKESLFDAAKAAKETLENGGYFEKLHQIKLF